jgi:pectate lyase
VVLGLFACSGSTGTGLSTAGTSAGAAAGTSNATGGAGGGATGGSANGGSTTGGSAGSAAGGTGGTVASPDLIGWAAVSGLGVDTTTGGGSLAPTVVTSAAALQTAVNGTAPGVVRISGAIEGAINVGSNKTIEGEAGSVFTGHLALDGSVNVILRDLTIVGYNCSDSALCSAGYDAVTVINGAHHVWVDHCDISDGSDGNLDITLQSDFATVSWTKFWYSGTRAGGHQFSNLVGGDDLAPDQGTLNVTWHHNWWADRANQRMPRVRFGKNHVFNNLNTAAGDSYCIGLGFDANILTENNVFIGVNRPINSTDFDSPASVIVSRGNIYTNTTGSTADRGTGVFTPPYPYTLDDANGVEAAVRSGAGPR